MDSVTCVMNTVHPNLPKARHSFTLHVYISTLQSAPQTALCALHPFHWHSLQLWSLHVALTWLRWKLKNVSSVHSYTSIPG